MARPKALAPLGGKPLVSWVVDVALRVAGEVVVVAKDDLLADIEAVVPQRTPVVADRGYLQSPLVAFVAGAAAITSAYVAFLACDLPFLKAGLLRELFARAEGVDAAIPKWRDGRIEPMVAVYRRASASRAADRALGAGRFANTDMIERLGEVRLVPVDELRDTDPLLSSFMNVNTPEDLEEAETRLKGGDSVTQS